MPPSTQLVAALAGSMRPSARRLAPLPPFPPGIYDRDLNAIWHGQLPRFRDFLRADAWGVPIPGLPFVPGGSSEHPERFLTYLAYKYAQPWVDKALTAHAERGYLHWVTSWPDARDDGGWSIGQFVAFCQYVQSWGFWTHVMLGSKVYDPRDQTPAQWQDRLTPVLTALAAARAADECCPAFEYDSFNVPGAPTLAVCHWIGQRAHAMGASCWLHFFPEHTWWGAPDGGPTRFAFWADLGLDVDGLDYQAVATWSVGELQARMVDTLNQSDFISGQHKLRLFENVASAEFTQDHPDELDACLKDYLGCCTRAYAPVCGAGNGLRAPNGDPL